MDQPNHASVQTRFLNLHSEITDPVFADWLCREASAIATSATLNEGEICRDIVTTAWQRWKMGAYEFRYQKLSLHVTKPLQMWCEKKWNFVVTGKMQSPLSMLKRQAEGERYIGYFFEDKENHLSLLPEHTGLTLLLHDLEHGYHFFQDVDNYRAQTYFFKWLLKNIDLIREFFWDDPILKDKIEYLMSDMNGNIIYLLKTFRGYADLLPKSKKNIFWVHMTEEFDVESRAALRLLNRSESSAQLARCQSRFRKL